jgi:hypothetical protein
MGLRLLLLSPDVAARSCSDCQEFLYFDKGPGQFGERVVRGGKPVRRPKGVGTACAWCPKIAPGDKPRPENAQELSQKNLAAYLHYLECKAVGRFPADAIVSRNAALCRAVEESAERLERARGGLVTLGSILNQL